MQKLKLPLLKDHHTHPTIGAAFAGGINIRNIQQKSEVIELIQASREELTVVFGWNSSAYRFSNEELEAMPPVVICNLSLHGFLLNSSAKQRLAARLSGILLPISIIRSGWRPISIPF